MYTVYGFNLMHMMILGTSLGSPQGSTQIEQALREPVTLERSTSVYIPARRSTSI